ncbi:two component transcriptional regulator, winged helix family [Frankia casuarinae]|uniref:Two component transcriptional regulator, winged helix family n=2 Tax=Frankiaceae TaxID=74712 RepID=Q2J7U7_FRACC|nr:two component transcriptional regulator, winged helix family [Frankia casuarinae]EYT91512.1 two component transcriptional regulator, winged helix family [Frankia casuarinae]
MRDDARLGGAAGPEVAGGDGADMTRLLFVEDEPQLLRAMRITLRARGFEVRTALDGRHALSEAASCPPDLVILDLGLPDMDGVEVIQGLRAWTGVPIIVLSGRASGHDKVAALDAGADDYVTKPFSIDELLARVRAVTRRATSAESVTVVDLGRYRIDLGEKRISSRDSADADADADAGSGHEDPSATGGEDKPDGPRLTPTEWRLLEALVRHPGKLVSHQQLISQVWGPGVADDSSSLRLYINKLRRKLEPDPTRPRYLTTEPGLGYRYQP